MLLLGCAETSSKLRRKDFGGAGPAASEQRGSRGVAVDPPSQTAGEAVQQQKSPATESEPAVPGSLPGPPRFKSPTLPLVLRWRVGFQVRQRIGHFRCQMSLRIEYEHECALRRNGVEIFPSDACWNIDLGVARSPHRVAIHTQRKRVAVALVLIEYHDRQLCS